MTTPHDKALSELKGRLAKLPKADRGISWQLYNWQHTEELTVYGSTANCLKWILDNTEEIIAALHAPITEAGNGGDGWLDISSAPKTGESILADHAQWGEPEIVAWNDGEDAWCTGSWCWKEAPTHWRQLPARRSTPSNEGEKP